MQDFTGTDIASLRRTFESCDSNGDGFIDREDFHALLNRLDDDVAQAEALLDFEVADTEGDEPEKDIRCLLRNRALPARRGRGGD